MRERERTQLVLSAFGQWIDEGKPTMPRHTVSHRDFFSMPCANEDREMECTVPAGRIATETSAMCASSLRGAALTFARCRQSTTRIGRLAVTAPVGGASNVTSTL